VGGKMIIPFLVSLLILIILHEAAHLIVAKKCGCGVLKYSIGFGKPILFSKKIKGTIYQITPWLLGGFCELKGELDSTKDKDAFINLSYRKKLAIAIAGCAVNMITGVLVMLIGIKFNIYYLSYFGYLSFILGATNWFLPIPCLDGGYALWYPILTRIYGKEKGTKIFAKAVQISFVIVMVLNIACIPLLIQFAIKGVL
jgi:membrane-associated protease RseP (regulator of RpoE activity)